MDEEMKQLFKELEEQGWEPKLCDTPVPCFDTPVMCGNPNYIGDCEYETEMMPEDWTEDGSVFFTTAKGDSMIDAGIHEGDRLFVKATNSYNDGDVLIVMLDGKFTLKGFTRDAEGNPWLLPQNPKYKAFRLFEHQNVRVRGVVMRIMKPQPHISYRSCMRAISDAKQAEVKPKEITREQAVEVIKILAPEILIGRLWYAVFRVLMDKKVIETWDYDAFCIMVKNAVPEHQHLPIRLELQRMAVKSFAKAVVLWDENDAPVQGKRFKAYVDLAKKTKELLDRI